MSPGSPDAGASDEARRRLEEAGQAHLAAHADTLPDEDAARFLEEAAAAPWAELQAALRDPARLPVRELRPPQALTWRRQQAQGALRARLAELGNGLVAGGRVAALLLAGGQGTRLGHAGPKGTVVFGPEEDRTLYRIHGERIAAAQARAGRPLSWYVLVSRATEDATRAAFEEAAAWGVDPAHVHFLRQGDLPALDDEGRALLAGPGQLALAPDGHGGALTTLHREGVLADLVERGVDVLTTYQVDNPLARPFEPVMLGWMVERKAQIVSKGVRKATPDEKVGVFARDLEGRSRIVEYSELPEDGAEELVLGSIALHAFSTRWLHELMEGGYLPPLHTARKKVPYMDEDGARIEPEAPNATKLERFIFDVFPEAPRVEVHEVPRTWEFAPVKNATGVDSLVSSRLLVDTEVRRWHRERGREEPESPSLRPRELDGAEGF